MRILLREKPQLMVKQDQNEDQSGLIWPDIYCNLCRGTRVLPSRMFTNNTVKIILFPFIKSKVSSKQGPIITENAFPYSTKVFSRMFVYGYGSV